MENKQKFGIAIVTSIALYYIITVAVTPLFSGFYLGGFEEQAQLYKVFLYTGLGLAGLIGSLVLTYKMYVGSYDEKESGIFLPWHNPWIGSKIINSVFVFTGVCLILFLIMGIYSTSTQTFFEDIPVIQQTFTNTGKVLYSAFPAAPAENITVIFLHFLALFFIYNGVKKIENKESRVIIYFALSVLSAIIIYAIFGFALHKLRYGSSELTLFKVAFFWAFMGFLNSISGSVIPGEVMHVSNNVFLKLSELASSELIVSISIALLIIIILIYGLIYYLIIRKRKYIDLPNV